VRDALDHRRILSIVALALLPAALLRAWSVGQRLQLAAAAGQATGDWGSRVYAALPGAPFDPSALGCLVHGLLYYVPAVAVAALAGGAVEWAGATRRRRPLDESFALHALLVPLLLPPETPLGWVAAATALGAVVARELFGTAPRNLLHPALAAQLLALLALRAPLDGGPPQVLPDASWGQAFLGRGGAGGDAVAALWSLPGAALLLITRSASWRTMLGMALGTLAASLALGAPGGLGAAPRALPFQWHLVLGGGLPGDRPRVLARQRAQPPALRGGHRRAGGRPARPGTAAGRARHTGHPGSEPGGPAVRPLRVAGVRAPPPRARGDPLGGVSRPAGARAAPPPPPPAPRCGRR
jgi:Na+-transporting NADH:ubiquinone oxidoreductase subunit B